MLGAWPEVKAIKSRPKPLPSGQVSTGAPSCSDNESASYQSCNPADTGGSDPEGAELITAVCWELAVWLATLFVAVTCARMVEPTSAEVSVSVFAVAPEMSTQPFPAVSQRRHWKA
jgi:hypothetical protein